MPSSFDLRPAGKADLAFCWPIYRDTMRPLMAAPDDWHEDQQRRVVERALVDPGASILSSAGAEAGWLHVTENGQIIALKQLLIVPALRNRGLGTNVLGWMKERADRKRKDFTVELLAESPARRLLERLDFKAVPGTGRMVVMRY
jgi:GNAT superfamily N-acetyltransferase